jgi:hypothetical protein
MDIINFWVMSNAERFSILRIEPHKKTGNKGQSDEGATLFSAQVDDVVRSRFV